MGIQGTRSGEVLKLWLGLRQLGEKGIENLLEKSIYRRRYLQDQLDESRLDVITGPLHLISCTGKYVEKSRSSEWSLATRMKLLDHNFMLSRPLHNGRYYLKAVMGNPHTKENDLRKLASLLNQSALI